MVVRTVEIYGLLISDPCRGTAIRGQGGARGEMERVEEVARLKGERMGKGKREEMGEGTGEGGGGAQGSESVWGLSRYDCAGVGGKRLASAKKSKKG